MDDPRAALRRELDRWCACKRFRYQFSLIAKRRPPAGKCTGNPSRGRHGSKSRLSHPTPHGQGLATVKHTQALAAESGAQQGRAFVALAEVAAGGGWPESMLRELQACHTPAERQAWAEKWGAYLSGQAQRANPTRAPSPGKPQPS